MKALLLPLALAAASPACGSRQADVAERSACSAAGAAALAALPKDTPPLPALSGRVVDGADLLKPEAEARITGALRALETETSDQLVVVTTPSLGGQPIDAYGLRLGNGWGIGQKHLNNGVLLIVAPAEQRVRIEVGCGLEGLLTDERAHEIIVKDLMPNFAGNAFEAGIDAGIRSIRTTLLSDTKRPQTRKDPA
jgi:uncharacterized protein